MKEDDNNWPLPDRVGRQELEVIIGSEHTSFTCTKLGSVLQVQQSKDPDGLKTFYYLVQVSGADVYRPLGRRSGFYIDVLIPLSTTFSAAPGSPIT
jgi:hypothetical protein